MFRTLSVEPDPAAATASKPTQHENAVAIQMIRIALSALWAQFVIAVAHLFTLASVASAFVLWLLTPDPNTKQLIGMGMYAAFILAANGLVMWSRKR